MSNLEIVLSLAGLIYVVLASLNKSSCWIFGIISSALLAYVSFYNYNLYADSALNIFYVVVGFYGLWTWYRGSQEEQDKEIRRAPFLLVLITLVLGLAMSLVAGYFMQEWSSAFATYWDAATTVFSLFATWFLVKRYIENWYMWIVIDLIMVWLYHSRGGTLTAILFLVYALVAVYGAFQWRKRIRRV